MGARGGLSGSPWAQPSLRVSLFGGTFFTHSFVHYHFLPKSDLRQNMYPKWCQNPLKMYLQIAILFFYVFLSFLGALRSQNMCLGHTCAVQITSGTDHMAHVIGGKIVRKGTQIHQESMTRTSPRKDMKKVALVLNMCQKCVTNGVQKNAFIFAFCRLAPPVAALALQSSS